VNAPAKFATKRTSSRRTMGGAIGMVADALGKPFMPWQQQVVDVATEMDAAGRLVYEIVLVTVPRQSGKTTLLGAMQIHRAMTMPGVRCFYTAQTGKDARTRFEDLVSLVTSSALKAVTKARWSAGSERITFPNGSSVCLFAPTMDAIHGETPPLVTFDEIWKYDEALGDALVEGAVIPAQMTLSGRRQISLVSTAGTALSTFMRKWVERGRDNVRSGGKAWPKLAYFEWSLADGDDPDDPTSYERFHPACGHTVTAEELAESAPASRAERLRAMFNVWTEAEDPLFSAEHFKALVEKPKEVPALRELAVTYAVGGDSEHGVVMASWRDVDGRPTSRVLHSAPGTVWMVDLLANLARRWRPAVIGADDGGQTRRITDRLRGVIGDDAVTTTGGRDFGTACMSWIDLVETNALKHDGSRALGDGVQHLVLRQQGDLTVFDRKNSTGSIAGPEASAVGVWLYDHRERVPETLVIHN
jgi:hypothetical protein